LNQSSADKKVKKRDARNPSYRLVRVAYHCTICGEHLGEDKSGWALIWESQECGACWTCVEKIRSEISKD